MGQTAYRFQFATWIAMDDVSDALSMATLAAESIHGRANVEMADAYRLEPELQGVFIDGTTDVGRTIARVLTGLVLRAYGPEAVHIHRMVQDKAKGEEDADSPK